MCGLAGIAGQLSFNDKKVFEELMLVNQFRGEDSAGMAVYDHDLNVYIHKAPYHVVDFLRMKNTNKFLLDRLPKSIAIIGHTRAVLAANKEICYENAHPFAEEHITLAHNGVIRSKGGLKDWDEKTLDSIHVVNNMVKYGEKETLEALFGDFALTWFNEKAITLNLARNAGRTLYFTTADDNKKMYWASEAGMLRYILARNNIKHKDVFLLDPDVWLSFDLSTEDYSKWTTVKFKEYAPYTVKENDKRGKAKDWKENKHNKIHLQLPTHARQEEVLKEMGVSIGDEEYMLFQGYDRLAGDPTRCNIMGTIQIYGDKADDTVRNPAIIYVAGIKVWDSVGHGGWAKIRIRGLQKSTVSNSWILICEFVGVCQSSVDQKKEEHTQEKLETIFEPSGYTLIPHRPIVFPSSSRARPLPGMRFFYKDLLLSDATWSSKVKEGCFECGDVPALANHDRLIWLNEKTFICFDCARIHNMNISKDILKQHSTEFKAKEK